MASMLLVRASGYTHFLQKPSPMEVRAAGGLLTDGRVAVDIGLLRFDAEFTTAMTNLAGFKNLPAVDLYDQITRGLTGQWRPEPDSGTFWRELATILRSPERPVAFHCAVVEGEFIHAGTTRSFRSLAAGSGGVLDSVVRGDCKIGHEAVILECALERPNLCKSWRDSAWTERALSPRLKSRKIRSFTNYRSMDLRETGG